jgi:hypothetical protein
MWIITRFNIYINKAIKEWKQTTQNGILLITGEKIQTVMYADNQVIITKTEDELQMAENELNKIIKKYDTKIFSSRTKTIEFCGKNVQRVKTETERKITE